MMRRCVHGDGVTFTLATIGLVLARDASIVAYSASSVLQRVRAHVHAGAPADARRSHEVPRVSAAMFAIGFSARS